MDEWQFQDRRRCPRVKCRKRIVIDDEDRPQDVFTEDVSVGGVRAVFLCRVPRGAKIGVSLYLEEDKPIKCSCRIVWYADRFDPLHKRFFYDTGLEFDAINEKDLRKIRLFVDRNLSGNED
jgi:hypothetical protein